MATGLAPSQANSILDSLATGAWIQLHVGDPGASGTANVAGNGTRKQPSWSAASGGAKTTSTAMSWTSGEVDTSEDYTHFSAWTASVGGSFLLSGVLTANAVVVGDTFQVPAGEIDLAMTTAS